MLIQEGLQYLRESFGLLNAIAVSQRIAQHQNTVSALGLLGGIFFVPQSPRIVGVFYLSRDAVGDLPTMEEFDLFLQPSIGSYSKEPFHSPPGHAGSKV